MHLNFQSQNSNQGFPNPNPGNNPNPFQNDPNSNYSLGGMHGGYQGSLHGNLQGNLYGHVSQGGIGSNHTLGNARPSGFGLNQGLGQGLGQGFNQNLGQGMNQDSQGWGQGLGQNTLSSNNSYPSGNSLGLSQGLNGLIQGSGNYYNQGNSSYAPSLNHGFTPSGRQGYVQPFSSSIMPQNQMPMSNDMPFNQGLSQTSQKYSGFNTYDNSTPNPTMQNTSQSFYSDNSTLMNRDTEDDTYSTPYLQKVSNRNPNGMSTLTGVQPMNQGGFSYSTSQTQPSPFSTTQGLQTHSNTRKQNIWKSNDSSIHTSERPKRAYANPSNTSNTHTSNHHRSLSAGNISTRPSLFTTRPHYSGYQSQSSSNITSGISNSMSTPSLPIGSFNPTQRVPSFGSLDQLLYGDSRSYSHSSCSSDDELDDRYDFNMGDYNSFHAFSTSPQSSFSMSTSSHGSVGSSGSFFSQKSYGYPDISDSSALMKIPENAPYTSYNPHVLNLESPPKHTGPFSFVGSTASSHTHSTSSEYSQFGNSGWPSRNVPSTSFFSTNPPPNTQAQSIGANLQIIYNHGDTRSNDDDDYEPFRQNYVTPRYSTTPSSPATSRSKRKSHSTPVSPARTPNGSPPKGYGRKPRSLGPSPQKPRPGNSLHYNGDTSSKGASPPKSRSKGRGRTKEDSHASKQKYKDLSRQLKEMASYAEAKGFASGILNDLPVDHRWKVCMELADMAKRENLIDDARHWFMQVNKLQPQAAQGWLEYAKLEEECGDIEQCHKLLMIGLQHCQQNESLLIKAVKFYEGINRIDCAREILGRLQYMSIEKNWKIFLEGALLESRDGNAKMAREIFKLLMHKVKRHGPIFYEAYRLEERCEEYGRALRIVEKGLQENQRYGPLWFAYLHLLEREAAHKAAATGTPIDLTKVRESVAKAVKALSSELVWKIYFEAAHIEERANQIAQSRLMYAQSAVNCLKNLRWKVWLAGARTELNAGNHEVARELLNRALKEVPNKTRAQVLIECSRLEEYFGNIDRAREYLARAKAEAKHEWKVFLESILLEMRANNIRQAIQEAHEALKIHRGTGRLWAVLIQLKMIDGPDEQMKIFRQAVEEVPKSGEVWCEGARIRLNPLSPKFNLEVARTYLDFAIKFTPQYGDSFIEYLRLDLLTRGPRLEEQEKLYLEQLCVNADPNYGPLWFFCKLCPTDPTRSVLRRAKSLLRQELLRYQSAYQKAILRSTCRAAEFEPDPQYKLEDFAMSLQSLTNANDDESRKKRIFGSEQLCA